MKKVIKVSFYENCFITQSSGVVNLAAWLSSKYEPLCKIVDQIRSTNDIDTIRHLKSKLYAITPSGLFSERTDKGLIEHSGLLCIDIDGKDNPEIVDIEDLKLRLSKLAYIMYCGLSVSGKGLYCLIQIAYPEKHSSHFYALEKSFSEMGIVIDSSCSNLSRLRYYSYDDNAYFNWESDFYSQCLDKPIKKNKPRAKKDIVYSKEEQRAFELNKPELSGLEQLMQSCFHKRKFFPVLMDEYTWYQKEVYTQLDPAIIKEIDITKSWQDWFIICNRLAVDFGEKGRSLFHDVCQFYPNYTEDECDTLYSSCLQKPYRYAKDKFLEILKKYDL